MPVSGIIDMTAQRIAISTLKGMSVGLARRIESTFGSLDDFFKADDRMVASVMGVSSAMFSRESRDKALEVGRQELAWASENGVRPLYFSDECYPQRLSDCVDAPVMLYSFGRMNLNSAHVMSIVGTRHATAYGQRFIKDFLSDLSGKIPDLLVVSGLAYGIDVCAHRESLSAGLPTVGVVAHGLSTIYPAVHRQVASEMVSAGGGLVTDYLHDAPIHKGNFLARNRIVAGMCDAVVVVESASKGGALVTARLASDYGREVFAVPGRTTDIYSAGCNRLIYKNVASVVTSADELIDAVGWTPVEQEGNQKSLFPQLTDEQQKILDYLILNADGVMINKISVDLNIPVARLIPVLGDMEFNELVMSVPGGKYAVVGKSGNN